MEWFLPVVGWRDINIEKNLIGILYSECDLILTTKPLPQGLSLEYDATEWKKML